MLANIIFGFLIPWVFGIYLFKKSPIIVLLIFPMAAIISSIINATGYKLEFWDFTPLIKDDETLSALPFDIGLYPVLASYLIYWIRKNNRYTLIKIAGICLLTTAFEFVGFLCGKVVYKNNWNVGWTLLSYLIAFVLVYLYYRLLLRYKILDKS